VSSARSWTVLELLQWTTKHFEEQGIESARLDAECLLAAALQVERLQLYLDYDKPVQDQERAQFRELVKRRAAERIPVAYLLGTKEFWSLSLEVTSDVLIPRPDTEVLVAAALEKYPDAEVRLRVLDVGTGSGAVALALATERPQAEVTATELSKAALEVGIRNADKLGLAASLRFLEGDLFAPVAAEKFDMILANLPYVPENQESALAPELQHEPRAALFSGPDGLSLLRRFLAEVRPVLAEGGVVLLEMGPEQIEEVSELCRAAGLSEQTRHRDIAGRQRVLCAR
jgi:release factor glutamine methyltransferase